MAAWLTPRGLVFNEDKTRIVHLDDGLNFLGFNVRRYRGKLLIKPSKAAVKRIRARLTAEMRALRGHNAQMVLIRLNPIIRGWSAYYRHAVSARVFNELDSHVWKPTYRWAKLTHPHKGKRWITSRYFGAFNSARRDRWVFGDRDSGAYLMKFAWTKITRHTLVKGWASPDDPVLTDYWVARRRRGRPPLDRARLRLLLNQHGRCPLCGELLLHADTEPQHPDDCALWITATSRAIRHHAITLDVGPGHRRNASPSGSSTRTADAASQTAPAVHQHLLQPRPRAFGACLSPVRRKGARRVLRLRGRRRSNAPPLPDYWAVDVRAASLRSAGAFGASAGSPRVPGFSTSDTPIILATNQTPQ